MRSLSHKQPLIIFVLTGLFILGYGGYQLFKTKTAQKIVWQKQRCSLEQDKSAQETDKKVSPQDFYPE